VERKPFTAAQVTRLIAATADSPIGVVSRILGHASVATTGGVYGHVQPSMLRRSAERMNELMKRAAGD
jgi:integrase